MGCQTDPIGDFLTVIRNGVRANKQRVTVPASNLIVKITEILKREGYIENFKAMEEEGKRFIRIHLRYLANKESAIRSLKRVSKPGIHYYAGAKKIPRVMGGLGVAILSTSKGIMTDREARQANAGGEILCHVW